MNYKLLISCLFISALCFSQESVGYLDNGWDDFYHAYTQKDQWDLYGLESDKQQLFIKRLIDENDNYEKHKYFIALQMNEQQAIFVISEKRRLSIRFENKSTVCTTTGVHQKYKVTNWHMTQILTEHNDETYYGEATVKEGDTPSFTLKMNAKKKQMIEQMPYHLYIILLQLIAHAKISSPKPQVFMGDTLRSRVKWALKPNQPWWRVNYNAG